MSQDNPTSECPHCGTPLMRDVLTGDLRPCNHCGSMIGSINEKAEFEPDHLERLRKQKIFEIGIVVTLIIVGVVYLSAFSKRPSGPNARSTSIDEFSTVIDSRGYELVSESNSEEKQFHSYQRSFGILQHDLHVIAPTQSDQVEAFTISASVPAGEQYPQAQQADDATQKSFNSIVNLAESLLPTSTDALKKAAATVTEGKGSTRHEKGVAQTTDGWKVTYIMYRKAEDDGSEIPLLLFLFQRLDAASNPDNESFNRVLFNGIGNGKPIQSIIDEIGAAPESDQ
jgi:hypothetical protein